MRRAMLLTAVVVALPLSGCASGKGAYEKSMASAERAKTSGRYDEAAASYGEAAKGAKKTGDRDEALYLQAATLAQAGRTEEAKQALDDLTAKSPKGQRAERAALDRAMLEIESGNEEKGYQMLEAAILAKPTMLARRAIRKLLDHEEEKGKGRALAWLKDKAPKLAGAELQEDADYLTATWLERGGELQAARDGYVACAKTHPYPKGSLFDDAWFHAASLDVKLSQPALAVDHLRAMLKAREVSTLGQGSYERPRYAAAQFEIAKITRDQLKDRKRAREEFHKVFSDHKTSVLRDDALFEEILLARADGDRTGVCGLTETLVKELSTSRYAACSRELCSEVAPPAGATCREYVKARIEGRELFPDADKELPE